MSGWINIMVRNHLTQKISKINGMVLGIIYLLTLLCLPVHLFRCVCRDSRVSHVLFAPSFAFVVHAGVATKAR